MDIVNPYTPSESHYSKRSPKAELELAERGTRLFARILDSACLVLPGIVAALAIPRFLSKNSTTNSSFIPVLVLVFLAYVGYSLWLMHSEGQTIGKKMLGIKVVRTDGSRLDLGRWIGLRILPVALISIIPVIGYFAGLVDAAMIFRDSKRCLHDDIADTIVVNK